MARTPSAMVELGSRAPDFLLPDTVSGSMVSLKDVASDTATVVMFICNHCPFVKHIHSALASMAKAYKSRGISFVAISSNDVANYPDDSPEKMKQLAENEGFCFPYLYDETQEVARAFQATCTPDIFVYDSSLKLVYRGQFDDSRPGGDTPASGADLAAALDAILSGQSPAIEQKPSIGCNIKWKQ